jgi:hypothetical protein
MVHQTPRQSTSNMIRDGEIVVLAGGIGSRSCGSHEKCGDHLAVGDLVKFKVCVMELGEEENIVIKAVSISDIAENCHAGFFPRYIVYGQRLESV